MNSFFDIEQRAAGYVRLLTDKRETPLRYTRAGEPFALLLRLRCPPAFTRARFYLGNDDGILVQGAETSVLRERETTLLRSPDCTLDKGLYFFHFELETENGLRYTSEEMFGCTLADRFSGEWQLLVYDEEPARPDDPGIIYHVFVDRFRKAGDVPRRPDAVYREDWGGGIPEYADVKGGFLRNNSFFGGTLYGVTEKLEYIRALGASVIYLSPVAEAYSNHKYDVGDFMKVDAGFGGDRALAELTEKAASLGIRVMLDGVFNHVGDNSVYFNKYGTYPSIGAYQSKESPYADWFTFYRFPDLYECWWGVTNLPKVRKTPEYQAFITEQVIPHYMRLGVGGWRLDVVDEYSGAFLEGITRAVRACDPQAPVIGEVWEDASCKVAYGERKNYFCGGRLDGVTNYPLRDALIAFLTGRDTQTLALTLHAQYLRYPAAHRRSLMNMLGSHDTVRIVNALAGADGEGLSEAERAALRLTAAQRQSAVRALKAAYLFLCAQVGWPCLYYGDETALEGCADPFCRRPYPWGSADAELIGYFRRCAAMRREYGLGFYTSEYVLDAPEGVFAAVYEQETRRFLVILNGREENFSFEEKGLYKDILDSVIYDTKLTVKEKSCAVFVRLAEKS
ncbi:MAG TPA: glycoside hydrolase family 13 protein [Firmicutes bacterium]|nr:glycoside hydrolase family 13 protein [Bacillota bacterium]